MRISVLSMSRFFSRKPVGEAEPARQLSSAITSDPQGKERATGWGLWSLWDAQRNPYRSCPLHPSLDLPVQPAEFPAPPPVPISAQHQCITLTSEPSSATLPAPTISTTTPCLSHCRSFCPNHSFDHSPPLCSCPTLPGSRSPGHSGRPETAHCRVTLPEPFFCSLATRARLPPLLLPHLLSHCDLALHWRQVTPRGPGSAIPPTPTSYSWTLFAAYLSRPAPAHSLRPARALSNPGGSPGPSLGLPWLPCGLSHGLYCSVQGQSEDIPSARSPPNLKTENPEIEERQC